MDDALFISGIQLWRERRYMGLICTAQSLKSLKNKEQVTVKCQSEAAAVTVKAVLRI